MTLRIVRAHVAIAIIALAMLTPMLAGPGGRHSGEPTRLEEPYPDRRPDAVAFAQGDNDDDNEDDSDNDDDADNDDGDDDDEDFDNVSVPASPAAPTSAPPAAASPP